MFKADHVAPVYPPILEEVARCSAGYEPGYGRDRYTGQVEELFRQSFGPKAQVFLVAGGGTAANALALQAVTEPYQAIICADAAHIANSETGSAEYATRSHLISLPTVDGKLRPEQIKDAMYRLGNPNYSQPAVLSLSQPTELGTVYRLEELVALTQVAHELGLVVHMDGARLFNAAAALGTSLAALTSEAGVDVLSVGLGKNGGFGFGDAVVFFDADLATGFEYRRRQAGHSVSKARILASQWIVMLTDNCGLELARHANDSMQRLVRLLASRAGVELEYPVETNCLLARLAPTQASRALRHYGLATRGDPKDGLVRIMTSYAITEADIDKFVQDVWGS